MREGYLGGARGFKEWQKTQSSSHMMSLTRRIHKCEAYGPCCERRHQLGPLSNHERGLHCFFCHATCPGRAHHNRWPSQNSSME